MNAEPTYTLSEMVERLGLKRRTIQFWADGSVLIAEPGTDRAGTGNHRVFSRPELLLAAVLAALSSAGIPVGTMLLISRHLRLAGMGTRAFKSIGDLGDFAEHFSHARQAIERAIAGEGEVFLIFSFDRRDEGQVSMRFVTDRNGPPELDRKTLFAGTKAVFAGVLDLASILSTVAE